MQKYTIFTKYHSVCITNNKDVLHNTDNKTIIQCDFNNYRNLDFKELLNDKNDRNSIIIYSKDIEPSKILLECIKHYHFVQASGGIVINPKKEILFIYRNGKYDLPKGHREQNETEAETALREVEEECGIKDLVLKEKAGVTYHTYFMKGKHELKETHWYFMESNAKETFPQKEEGIERVEWIKVENLNKILSQSYISIRDLFSQIKLQ